MSVIIRNMEMPESCFMCELMHKTEDKEYMICSLAKFKCSSSDFYGYFAERRNALCPLEEVTE